jgi:hypothetical protein
MNKAQLVELLNGYGDDEEVLIEVRNDDDENNPVEDGEIMEIVDDRSVLFSLGAIHILADRMGF